MQYPQLKQISNEFGYRIVLFTEPNKGIVMETNYPLMEVGYQGDFSEELYAKFHGTVRLTNGVFEDNLNDPEEQYGDE